MELIISRGYFRPLRSVFRQKIRISRLCVCCRQGINRRGCLSPYPRSQKNCTPYVCQRGRYHWSCSRHPGRRTTLRCYQDPWDASTGGFLFRGCRRMNFTGWRSSFTMRTDLLFARMHATKENFLHRGQWSKSFGGNKCGRMPICFFYGVQSIGS